MLRVFLVRGKVGGVERERRGKSRDGRRAVVHLEWTGEAERFVRNSVVGKTNTLGERRPVEVVGRGEELHCSIPEPPPTFYLSIALRVVATGGGASRAGSCGDLGKEFGHEFLRFVAVDDVGSAAAEKDLI